VKCGCAPTIKKGRQAQACWTDSDPLGFYVLTLLIVESTLTIVLTAAGFDSLYKWYGFLCMIGVFAAVVLIVTVLTFFNPRNLLYGKEEHSTPQIEPSALKDQIEDIIHQRVKSECLTVEDNRAKLAEALGIPPQELYTEDKTRQGRMRLVMEKVMNWKDEIKDPDEIKVFMALDGPKYTWRTVSAVARQTGVPEDRVLEILERYNMRLTRLSEIPSASGTPLVGLLERVGA
jgi:hypothetical protein